MWEDKQSCTVVRYRLHLVDPRCVLLAMQKQKDVHVLMWGLDHP